MMATIILLTFMTNKISLLTNKLTLRMYIIRTVWRPTLDSGTGVFWSIEVTNYTLISLFSYINKIQLGRS